MPTFQVMPAHVFGLGAAEWRMHEDGPILGVGVQRGDSAPYCEYSHVRVDQYLNQTMTVMHSKQANQSIYSLMTLAN